MLLTGASPSFPASLSLALDFFAPVLLLLFVAVKMMGQFVAARGVSLDVRLTEWLFFFFFFFHAEQFVSEEG